MAGLPHETQRTLRGHQAARGKVPTHDGARFKNTYGPLYPAGIIKSGTAAVATDVLAPGLPIPEYGTVNECAVALKTAPTGAALIVVFKLRRTAATIATVTVAAGTLGASATASTAVEKFDLIQTDITQVGSTVAGADVAAWVRVVP